MIHILRVTSLPHACQEGGTDQNRFHGGIQRVLRRLRIGDLLRNDRDGLGVGEGNHGAGHERMEGRKWREGVHGLLLEGHYGGKCWLCFPTVCEGVGDDLEGSDDAVPPTPNLPPTRPHRQKVLQRAFRIVLHLRVVRIAVVSVRPAARTTVDLDRRTVAVLVARDKRGRRGNRTR